MDQKVGQEDFVEFWTLNENCNKEYIVKIIRKNQNIGKNIIIGKI